jgi:hypothetical protein
VSSRQEEKQRRREEREAQERAAAISTARRRRLQAMAGGILAVVAVAAIVVALVSGGGGGSSSTSTSTKPPAGAVPLPPVKLTDLTAAAKAAGCQVRDYPNFGQTHVTTPVTYQSNPPTSGNHNPTPASDGIYNPGQEPAKEHYVHSLEHGRVEIQYRPGTPAKEIGQLQTLFNEPLKGRYGEPPASGYKKLLFENNTAMPYAVAATAWLHAIGCPTFNPQVFDALRAFAVKYVDTAPEQIPFPE